MVSRERQMWHCFGCNEGGDMFEFIKKIENIDFPEALKILANKAGVHLQYQDPKTTNLKTRILSMNEIATDWFSGQLLNSSAGARALKYLREARGLNDQLIKDWQLGYALDSWDALGEHLRNKQFTREEIIQSGLVVPKSGGYEYYDRFRDRIMFPILDYHGNAVGFTGRAMKAEEQAKYVNTPQTAVYNKSEVIFGLYQAKQHIKDKNFVVIVEGNMDVIGSVRGGVKNVVAVSGTAFTREQVKILQRYTNNIIFSFDADSAGIRAAERAIALAWQEETNVKVAVIPKNIAKDPDELAQKDPAAWQSLVTKAIPAMEYFLNLYLVDYHPEKIESKKLAAKNLLNIVIKLENQIEQDFYLKKISEKLNVSESSLRSAIDKAKNKVSGQKMSQPAAENNQRKINIDKKSAVTTRLLSFMLVDPDYAVYISEQLSPDYLSPDWQEVYRLLVVFLTKQLSGNAPTSDPVDYVTKSNPSLTTLANSLIIKKEELRELSYAEAVHEIKQHLGYLKKNCAEDRLNTIKKEMRELENSLSESLTLVDREKVNSQIKELLSQFNVLSAELKDTDF